MKRERLNPTEDLVQAWREGDRGALDELVERTERELRLLARRQLHAEYRDRPFQSAELVAEAYLRLMKQRKRPESRAHFLGLAAHLMRRILMSHARDRRAAKRGGGTNHLTLDAALGLAAGAMDLTRIIAVNDAIDSLEAFDPRAARVAEMRAFAGMENHEIAAALSISVATVKRDWTMASAWLKSRLA